MKATLPTNYQDDILNVSTEGKRKYRMNYNDDGTVSFIDVTPYDQEGSDYGAGDINATNEAVNQSLDKSKVIDDVSAISAITQSGYAMGALAGKAIKNYLTADNAQEFQFAYDSESGKYGYKVKEAGTDVFVPFSSADLEKAYTFNQNGSGENPSFTFSNIEAGDYLAHILTVQLYASANISSFDIDYELLSQLGYGNASNQEFGVQAFLCKITVSESGSFTLYTNNGNTNRVSYVYMDLFTL